MSTLITLSGIGILVAFVVANGGGWFGWVGLVLALTGGLWQSWDYYKAIDSLRSSMFGEGGIPPKHANLARSLWRHDATNIIDHADRDER